MPQLIFGGLLAVILLGFYAWSIVDAVMIAQCMDVAKAAKVAGMTPQPCHVFTANMAFLLNSIGGLISATVVGVLGATKASELPGSRLFTEDPKGFWQNFGAFLPSLYILVWITSGVFTVIYGFGLYETDYVQPLTAQAKAWLGTAIAAVFAYFGINPEGRSNKQTQAISKIDLSSNTINLSVGTLTKQLSATAIDAHNNPIANLANASFQWTSDDMTRATVDQNGLVTWKGVGTCNITASANNVTSTRCVVTCT